jgi:hypothetical protein
MPSARCIAAGVHAGYAAIRSHRGFGEQQKAQMPINRPVKKLVALVLAGAAVAVATQPGTQALGARACAWPVRAATDNRGNRNAAPPILRPAPAAAAQCADRGLSGKDPARANVYVPPAPATATWQGQHWLQTHPIPQDLPNPRKTANVYVPPAAEHAPTTGRNYADQVSALSNEELAAAYGTAIPTWIPTAANTTGASDDDTNRWRIAAIAGGGLLAAFALGAAIVLRHRALRTGA